MSTEETARVNYQAAREEILERMRLREQTIGGYLAGVSAICAVVFSKDASQDARVCLGGLIPYLSLAVSLLVFQHIVAIEQFANFCREKIAATLKAKSADAPQWDLYTREVAGRESKKTVIRFCSHLFMIQAPAAAFGLVICLPSATSWQHMLYGSFAAVAWVAGLIVTFLSFGDRTGG